MTSMRFPAKLSARIGWISFVSLAYATLSCVGCSIHEHARWGQPEDAVTYLLSIGAYLSFGIAVVSFVAFVVVLAMEK